MTTAEEAAAHADRRLFSRLKETGHCTWLLVALVLLLALYPLIGESLAWKALLGVLNTSILVTAAVASSASRRSFAFAAAFALPAIGLHWAEIATHDPIVGQALPIAMALFYVFAIANLLAYVLRPGAVTGNKLHGAISAYIMIGLLWSFIYAVIDQHLPGSFDYMGASDLHVPVDLRRFIFFSFVTLTTTGYGDFVPATPPAQSAAVLEQLAGTFYLAVLIARLAGLYQPGSPSRH